MHNINFTIATIFSVKLGGINYTDTVVQPSPSSISRTFSSSQTKKSILIKR